MKFKDPEINPNISLRRLVTWKRLRTIQEKISKNTSADDQRGNKGDHNTKLTEDIKDLIILHCKSLPHRRSHYAHEKSSLQYFLNSTLNLYTMYNLFLEYYWSVTGLDNTPFSRSTYENFFNYHSNFSFQMPRTDVCNICYENENSGINNANIAAHKKKAADYFELKKKMLSEKNVLCLEFDYAQNLPMPKIPVSDQFFKRLMWLYNFNVHVHNTEKSYMFLSPEGLHKKGGSSVCNFVLYVIEREFDSKKYSKIYLFSDACGGQNRNYMVVRFFSSLSAHLKTEIVYLYPVRGHSFNQCDRNFGMYTQKKKAAERIETQSSYVKIIESARNPPFIIVQNTDIILKDYEKVFKISFKELKINSIYLLHLYPTGKVEAYSNNYEFKSHTITPNIQFN